MSKEDNATRQKDPPELLLLGPWTTGLKIVYSDYSAGRPVVNTSV